MKTLKDFETTHSTGQARVDDQFFIDYGFSEAEKQSVVTAFSKVSFLQELYTNKRLYVGSKYRKSGGEVINSYLLPKERSAEKKKAKSDKLNSFYDDSQQVKDLLVALVPEIELYRDKTPLGESYTRQIVSKLLERQSEFSVSIELFPEIEGDPKEGVTRSDCYDPNSKFIEFCPRNFEGTGIIARNPPDELFAHESAHAIDDLNDDSSADALESSLTEYFPELGVNIQEARAAIKAAAVLCSPDIEKYYQLEDILKEGVFTKSNAAFEFLSFHAERVGALLNKSSSKEEFAEKYSEFISQAVAKLDPSLTKKAKLFALDSLQSYVKDYRTELLKGGDPLQIEEIFKQVDQSFDIHVQVTLSEIAKEINETEGLLDPLKNPFESELKTGIESFLESERELSRKPVDELVESLRNKGDFLTVFKNLVTEIVRQDPSTQQVLDYNAPEKFHTQIVSIRFVEPNKDKIENYITTSIKSIVFSQKDHDLNEHAKEIQQEIDAKDLLSTETSQELETKKQKLTDIEKELEKNPTDPSLQTQKAILDQEIQNVTIKLKEVQEQKTKAEEEKTETTREREATLRDQENNEKQAQDAVREVYGKH